jgi:hypothetical protein
MERLQHFIHSEQELAAILLLSPDHLSLEIVSEGNPFYLFTTNILNTT